MAIELTRLWASGSRIKFSSLGYDNLTSHSIFILEEHLEYVDFCPDT